MSHRSRWECFRAIFGRYRKADRRLKQAILNEICANTGYHRRYAARPLNGHSHELRLGLKLFLPLVKLIRKTRAGCMLTRLYGPTRTLLDRVPASPGVDCEQATELQTLRRHLDPFALAQTIDHKLERTYVLTNRGLSPKSPRHSVTF